MAHKNRIGLQGTPICAFEVDDNADLVSSNNMRPIASYSWIRDGSRPHIAVPGYPRQYRSPRLPLTVPGDVGTLYIDRDVAICEELGISTLVPLAMAIDAMAPTFSFREQAELIISRNVLRNLLRWAGRSSNSNTGVENGPGPDPNPSPKSDGRRNSEKFRIDIEPLGEGTNRSMLWRRWEPQWTEITKPGMFRGYGQSFLPMVAGSKAEGFFQHYQMYSLNLGGHKVLLHTHVDACVPGPSRRTNYGDEIDDITTAFAGVRLQTRSKPLNTTPSPSGSSAPKTSLRTEPVQGRSESLKINPSSSTTPAKNPMAVKVRDHIKMTRGGEIAPLDSLASVKTLGSSKQPYWQDLYEQCYLAGVHHLYLARYWKGRFTSITTYDMREEQYNPQKEEIQRALGRVAQLIKAVHAAIANLGADSQTQGYALILEANGCLSLYRKEGASLLSTLPEDVQERLQY